MPISMRHKKIKYQIFHNISINLPEAFPNRIRLNYLPARSRLTEYNHMLSLSSSAFFQPASDIIAHDEAYFINSLPSQRFQILRI